MRWRRPFFHLLPLLLLLPSWCSLVKHISAFHLLPFFFFSSIGVGDLTAVKITFEARWEERRTLSGRLLRGLDRGGGGRTTHRCGATCTR
ncbi:hypothetical protein BC567DRAFT_219570 [Phyllosticta citribraziliensis]